MDNTTTELVEKLLDLLSPCSHLLRQQAANAITEIDDAILVLTAERDRFEREVYYLTNPGSDAHVLE